MFSTSTSSSTTNNNKKRKANSDGRLFIHPWVDKPRDVFSWVYPPNFFYGFIHPMTVIS